MTQMLEMVAGPSPQSPQPANAENINIWKKNRPVLHEHFIAQKRKLKEVKAIMERDYNFPKTLTPWQYECNLKELGLRKNMNQSELLIIDRHIRARPSTRMKFRWCGQDMPRARLQKRINHARRTSARADLQDDNDQGPLPALPDGFEMIILDNGSPDSTPVALANTPEHLPPSSLDLQSCGPKEQSTVPAAVDGTCGASHLDAMSSGLELRSVALDGVAPSSELLVPSSFSTMTTNDDIFAGNVWDETMSLPMRPCSPMQGLFGPQLKSPLYINLPELDMFSVPRESLPAFQFPQIVLPSRMFSQRASSSLRTALRIPGESQAGHDSEQGNRHWEVISSSLQSVLDTPDSPPQRSTTENTPIRLQATSLEDAVHELFRLLSNNLTVDARSVIALIRGLIGCVGKPGFVGLLSPLFGNNDDPIAFLCWRGMLQASSSCMERSIFELLLESAPQGSDWIDSVGDDCLWAATAYGWSGLVKAFLARGVSPLQPDCLSEEWLHGSVKVDSRTTMMDLATRQCDPSILQYLVDHGADPSGRSREQGSPLLGVMTSNAETDKKTRCLEVLLKAGADIDLPVILGHRAAVDPGSPMTLASEISLLDWCFLHSHHHFGLLRTFARRTPVARMQDLHFMYAEVELGASPRAIVEAMRRDGQSEMQCQLYAEKAFFFLCLSSVPGRLRMIRLFLESGVDGQTALYCRQVNSKINLGIDSQYETVFGAFLPSQIDLHPLELAVLQAAGHFESEDGDLIRHLWDSKIGSRSPGILDRVVFSRDVALFSFLQNLGLDIQPKAAQLLLIAGRNRDNRMTDFLCDQIHTLPSESSHSHPLLLRHNHRLVPHCCFSESFSACLLEHLVSRGRSSWFSDHGALAISNHEMPRRASLDVVRRLSAKYRLQIGSNRRAEMDLIETAILDPGELSLVDRIAFLVMHGCQPFSTNCLEEVSYLTNPNLDEFICLLVRQGVMPTPFQVSEGGSQRESRDCLMALICGGFEMAIDEILPLYKTVNPPRKFLSSIFRLRSGRYEHQTPLGSAIARGRLDVARKLLDRGADPNLRHVAGDFPLQVACDLQQISVQQKVELVRDLLRKGADVHTRGKRPTSFSAVELTASRGCVPTLQVLLEHGAALNQGWVSADGRELDLAAEVGRLDMVQLLLKLGVKSARPGRSGYEGAISIAKDQGRVAVYDVLKKYEARQGVASNSVLMQGGWSLDWV